MNKFIADYKTNPLRFSLEIICLFLNAIAAGYLAFTADNPNMLTIYIVWVFASIFGAIAAYMRTSFGVVALNVMFLIFDFVGIAKVLM